MQIITQSRQQEGQVLQISWLDRLEQPSFSWHMSKPHVQIRWLHLIQHPGMKTDKKNSEKRDILRGMAIFPKDYTFSVGPDHFGLLSLPTQPSGLFKPNRPET